MGGSGGAGPPPPVQLQRGAAGTTPGRIPRTVTLRARPCQRRLRSPPAGARARAPENISLRLPTPQPPPRSGPPLEGRGGGGKNEESAPMRPVMRLGGRGAHRGCAAASLRSQPTPAPHRPRTQKHWGPVSPRRPRPGSAASLPPRRSPGAGQRRGSGVLLAWARAPPPAAPKPAREAAPVLPGLMKSDGDLSARNLGDGRRAVVARRSQDLRPS
ncbi:synapsin-1-like [Muntiacus reevesi]|uniref:synapsin-1-like n=1 Tax=Muntiacus reevesi TaxID=9886 RepID=UPI0033075799